jgi:glycine/serine hydroxymethyltransferase
MTNLGGVVQMLKKEHDRLSKQIKAVSAALSAFGAEYARVKPRSGISAAGRASIAAAQRARWAKIRAKNGKTNIVRMPKRRTMSAAARRKIAAAQRARWAKVKAAKRTA